MFMGSESRNFSMINLSYYYIEYIQKIYPKLDRGII